MLDSARNTLKQHWFLLGLASLIPVGIGWGASSPGRNIVEFLGALPTSVCTAAILFLMSVTLNSGKLLASLRNPLPVLLSCTVNQIAIPLMCLPLLGLQTSADLRIGLLIAASVPCTMAAASVWTRRAGGNDAVSLLVTLLTNGLCFVITPFWLMVGTRYFQTADTSDALVFSEMVKRLVFSALVPAALGQFLRLSSRAELFVDSNKSWFSNTAQVIILTLVFVSSFRGGLKFETGGMSENLRHGEFAFVWACCIALHLMAMLIAWSLAVVMNLSKTDRSACMIAGSQKTLPIGILVSQATGMPFSLLPMLMFHASQLFIDTWIADRLKRPQPAEAKPGHAAPEKSDE